MGCFISEIIDGIELISAPIDTIGILRRTARRFEKKDTFCLFISSEERKRIPSKFNAEQEEKKYDVSEKDLSKISPCMHITSKPSRIASFVTPLKIEAWYSSSRYLRTSAILFDIRKIL